MGGLTTSFVCLVGTQEAMPVLFLEHTESSSAVGSRTPLTLYTPRSWFLSPLLVGRAELPPLTPVAACTVAVSLSPWGATIALGGD